MENAEETPVRLGTLFHNPTLPPTWWELLDESTNMRYYWNSITNATQQARPTTCPTCGSYIKRDDIVGHHMSSSPSAVQVYPNSTTGMFCSDDTNIFPTDHAHVDSLTSNVPLAGRFKDYLYVAIFLRDNKLKWYHLNLAAGGSRVKDHDSKNEFIGALLDEASQNKFGNIVKLNSSLYWFEYFPTMSESSVTSKVRVMDIENGEIPSWNEFTPLVKPRVDPRAVTMGGKIYVIGVEHNKEISFSVTPDKINDIEVLTGHGSRKWESLPIQLPHKIVDLSHYYVVAFDDQLKLVLGAGCKKYLYLYDVCTCHLEKVYIDGLGRTSWNRRDPPVVVGSILFFFNQCSLLAYDLVERSRYDAEIDGLDYSFIKANCNKYIDPRLIYLGGGKLCLICLKSRDREYSSTVHCCVFDVPGFIEQGGQRLLRGRLRSVQKFHIAYSERLKDVLVI